MHLAQVFQVEKDVKFTFLQVTKLLILQVNKNPNSIENEELKNGVSWAPSKDISCGISHIII